VIRTLIVAVCVVLVSGDLSAQTSVWQPSPGHTQILIWPVKAPDAQPLTGPETATVTDKDELVAGKPWTYVERVSQPTMTVYSPTGRNTGAAVVVFPGGGYWILAIDLEGTEVCDWLTAKGITCVLLKYRVPGNRQEPKSGPYPRSPMALEDAQRIEKRLYPPVDAADKESCRPDFAVAVYPGHMLENTSRDFQLNPFIPVTSKTPPTFLLQAEDDPVDSVKNSLVYYAALKKAGVTVEMHLYPHGGHAFGLRRTRFPMTAWPQLVETWLGEIGMVTE
jgi:acetyl esterase/lipase